MTMAYEWVSVGTSSLMIPPICFGTSGLGNMPDTYGYEVSEEQARATVMAIFEGPCAFLDTSRNYGSGRSEQRIGAVVRELGGWPAGAVLSTKLDRDMRTGRFDASRARESLEQSLKTLGVDSIDLLHLHDPEHAASVAEITGAGGALEALVGFRDEGLVRAIGLAAGRVDIMLPIIREWPLDAVITHNRYTLINRNADELISTAAQRGMTVLNAAPYAGGALAKGSSAHARVTYQIADAAMLAPVRAVEAVCAEFGVPVGAAALQFSMRDARIGATVCGVARPERVQQTLDWAGAELPAPLWEKLASLGYASDDPEANRVYKPE